MGRRPKKVEGDGGKGEASSGSQALDRLQELGLTQEEAIDMVNKVKNDTVVDQIVAAAKEVVEAPPEEPREEELGSKNARRSWADVVEDPDPKAMPTPVKSDAVGVKSWVDVASANRNPQNGIPLRYVEPGEVIRFSAAELSEGAKLWNNSLVGMVIGASPSYVEVAKYARSAWQGMGLGRVHQMSKGIYLFEFRSMEDRARVMEGHWAIYSRFPLLLKPWRAGVSVEDHFDRIPIWIQLPNLNLDLWAPANLGKIASYVGIPVTTDVCTAVRSRIDYARVLVEVSLKSKFPDSIPVQDGEGPVYNQSVVYEWKPVNCGVCGWFGHDKSRCKRKIVEPEQKVADKPKSMNSEKTKEKEAEGAVNGDAGASSSSVEGGEKEAGKQQSLVLKENERKEKNKSAQETPVNRSKQKQVVVSKTPILQNLPIGEKSKRVVENGNKGNGGKRNVNRPNG